MSRTTANNRTQVVMELTFAKHPVSEGRGGGWVLIMKYCVGEHADDTAEGPGVVICINLCLILRLIVCVCVCVC